MPENKTNFWEQKIYAEGKHLNKYPYDSVVSFIYNYYPKKREKKEVSIIEIGCGAGNNIWFCAREGFKVAGIDISQTAIDYARNRLRENNLSGDLKIGDFTKLPWDEEQYDLGIDRCATVCVGLEEQKRAIDEMYRILKKGALFFFNGYSCKHTSALKNNNSEVETTQIIEKGSLDDIELISYLSEEQVKELFAKKWEIISMKEINEIEKVGERKKIDSEWRIIAKKI